MPQGLNRFVLTASRPDHTRIPQDDLVGVTVILITCCYLGNEFIRIGYYVNNDYDPPIDRENLPQTIDVNQLRRNIMAEQPRVTRLPIDWTGTGQAMESGDADAEAEAQDYEQRNEDMAADGEGAEDDDSLDDDGEAEGDVEIDISTEMVGGNEDSMDVAEMQQPAQDLAV